MAKIDEAKALWNKALRTADDVPNAQGIMLARIVLELQDHNAKLTAMAERKSMTGWNSSS